MQAATELSRLQESAGEAAELLRLLANENRLLILCQLALEKELPVGSLARIHSGFLIFSSSGTTLMGMRAVLSAPLSLMPCLGSILISLMIESLSMRVVCSDGL